MNCLVTNAPSPSATCHLLGYVISPFKLVLSNSVNLHKECSSFIWVITESWTQSICGRPGFWVPRVLKTEMQCTWGGPVVILLSEVSRALVGIFENTPSSVSESDILYKMFGLTSAVTLKYPKEWINLPGGGGINPQIRLSQGWPLAYPRQPQTTGLGCSYSCPKRCLKGVWGGLTEERPFICLA